MKLRNKWHFVIDNTEIYAVVVSIS